MEFRAIPGKITIISKPPATADDEYTPEQRRIIEAQLAEGLEDIKQGRTYGPFDTVEEMIVSMKANISKFLRWRNVSANNRAIATAH